MQNAKLKYSLLTTVGHHVHFIVVGSVKFILGFIGEVQSKVFFVTLSGTRIVVLQVVTKTIIFERLGLKPDVHRVNL